VAVTVTDNRSELDQCDATTNFNTGTAITTTFAESTACVAVAYNETTGQLFYNGTTPDLSAAGNKLIYLWSACIATQNSYKVANPNEADSSHAMYLSDGTNNLIIFMSGNDRDVFKHADGQVTFQCFLVDLDYLDTVNTNGDLYATGGSYASFDPTSTTLDIGGHYVTLSKALGGGYNCHVDIIRYGTEGISITGGTTGDRGNFSEVATEDRGTANQKAHGIIREYTPGSYGVQGTMKFGTTGTGDSWFDDSGVSITFEDRLVSDDKYKLYVLGNTTGGEETHFYLADSTVASARPGVEVIMSGVGINTLDLDSVNFVNLLQPVSFPRDSASYTHTVNNCGFSNVGQVDPGTVDFINCTVANYDETYASGNGALLITSGSEVSNWANLNFVAATTSGHAIYLDEPGDYTLDNYTYNGYGLTGTTDAALYNNSGGVANLTIAGGDSPTYRNGAGATTNLITNPVTTLVTVKDITTGSNITGARVLVWVTDNANWFYQASVSITGTGTTATVNHTAHGISTGDNVIIEGANEDVYNGAYSVTVTGVDSYTYTTNETISTSPATGTLISTFAILSGDTDGSGQISDLRSVPSNQPILGWARKATGSPYYQQGPITGTIDKDNGISLTIQLIRDE
jgi:hypothetical protein